MISGIDGGGVGGASVVVGGGGTVVGCSGSGGNLTVPGVVTAASASEPPGEHDDSTDETVDNDTNAMIANDARRRTPSPTVRAKVVTRTRRLADTRVPMWSGQPYCSGNSNQIVNPYLVPSIKGEVRCGWVTSDGHTSSDPTGTSLFTNS